MPGDSAGARVGKDAVMRKAHGMVKRIGRAVAAPFIGLACIVFPMVADVFVSFDLRARIDASATG